MTPGPFSLRSDRLSALHPLPELRIHKGSEGLHVLRRAWSEVLCGVAAEDAPRLELVVHRVTVLEAMVLDAAMLHEGVVEHHLQHMP